MNKFYAQKTRDEIQQHIGFKGRIILFVAVESKQLIWYTYIHTMSNMLLLKTIEISTEVLT